MVGRAGLAGAAAFALALLLVPGVVQAQLAGNAPAVPLPAVAPALPAADAIKAIVVQGNARIEADTIRSYLTLGVGDPFDTARIDGSLKALFATGLFADVTINRQGDSLVVRVVENPIINRVTFEGNSHVDTDKLIPEVQETQLSVFSRAKVQEDVARLRQLYWRAGRFNASIRPRIVRLPQNRVDLVFEIREGNPSYVTRIDFIGNHHFSAGDLKDVMLTKEDTWWRFLSSYTSYDPDRLTYDLEQIRRFYLHNGYADFRVVTSDAELTPDRGHFFITIDLEEGDRYKFGAINLTNAIPDLDTGKLKAMISTRQGDWYDSDLVDATLKALTNAAANQGYAFASVKPVLSRDKDSRTISITYDIEQSQRIYVNRINISGNVRTLDKVIRREMVIAEGDAFSADKLDRSRQRIKDLNYFGNVDITNTPSASAPDRTDLNVNVTEKSTGSLNFGLGWSSAYGPLIEATATEDDLLGRGQVLSLSGELAYRQTLVNLGFTEPYFLDRHIVAGFDLFSENDKLTQYLDYNTGTSGGDLRMGYFYNDVLRSDWRYTASQTNIHNVQPQASQYIKDQAGVNTLSMIGHVLTYDKRDSRIDPTKGYYVTLGNDLAGPIGGNEFFRSSVAYGYYIPVSDQVVFLARIAGSYEFGYDNQQVRINQRLYLGGDSLRGFRDAGISPRDAVTLDPLGAIWLYDGSTELTFPTGLPKEFDLKGKIFMDFGSVGPSDPHIDPSTVTGAYLLRASVGFGLSWGSPLGPITATVGVPVRRSPIDQIEIFRFNFGTRF